MNLTNYNEKQKEAILKTDGPILVVAGAGSGKTKVLTTKIAYLVEIGIPASNILAITFTNKAAKEMKDRVVDMLGPMAYNIRISTFHSFGVFIMRNHYNLLGYHENFTILDSEDTLTIIKKIMKDLNIDIKEYNPRAIRNSISSAKNELVCADEFERFIGNDFDQKVFDIYKRYEKKLLNSNSLDFDDLLYLPIKLFKEHPEVLKLYQDIYQYILVDEYQDTNEAQYILIKMLSAKNKNICVVGDESQSIYSFRGANYHNILNFERDYKDCNTIFLEQNYRSTSNILDSANEIIKNNKNRKDKNLWTNNGIGEKLEYYKAFNEKDEANYVALQIEELIKSGCNKSNIAVLYRTNAQSRVMEEALLKSNIPYKVVGSFYFYSRKEIKDLISYLKLIHNTLDDISLLRVINVPKRGIGQKTVDNLIKKANEQNKSIYEVIDSGKELQFKKLIEKIRSTAHLNTLTELVDLVLEETGMHQELESEKSIESEIRLENLEEFKSITKAFEEKNGNVSLEDFLMEISLVADITEHKSDNDVVTLMTVHSAKGLEFENVFLIGMEEGIFPHNNSFFDEEALEEERRLCYVAITRAKKKLWLVSTNKRLLYGNDSYNKPSRFIDEIDTSHINYSSFKPKIFDDNEVSINPSSNIDENATYSPGEKVVHDAFGTGVVISIDGNILTIAFEHPHGIKKLIKGHKSIKKL
ncbi:MAG: UvrD-helicase domain-containing protein [Bacilli bacterium]|nr:UvrD-helicase domain-containing protein [Bacilli bacterium]